MESPCAAYRFKILFNSRIHIRDYQTLVECGKFTVGGFEWVVLYYPYQLAQADGHISLYLRLNANPLRIVKVFLCFGLVNKYGAIFESESMSGSFKYSYNENVHGFEKFMRRSALHTADYVLEDGFTIQCDLHIVNPFAKEAVTNKYFIQVPTSELLQNLNDLLQSGEGADVSFKVKDETFPAHRIILAARSSVFRAELLSPLKKSKMKCIEIEDMEPKVFKSMLQFIYTDMLDSNDGHKDDGMNEGIMAQHLIVAADRYGLDRLRLICEDKLAKMVGANNVVTTLGLALRHNCQNLKGICLDYMSSSRTLLRFVETDEFSSLMVNYPFIYKEVLENVVAKKN